MSQDTANVFFSEHVLKQMKDRKITRPMVLDVLRKGNIPMEPEPDIKTGHMKCRMQRFTAGKSVAIVAACEDEDATECVVVTAINIGD